MIGGGGGGDGGSSELLDLCQNDHDDPIHNGKVLCRSRGGGGEEGGGVVFAMK